MQKKRLSFPDTTLLINPHRSPQAVMHLERLLAKADPPPRIVKPASADAFRAAVREYCEGPDSSLLVWGGDGTAHEAVNILKKECVRKTAAGAGAATTKAVGFMRGGTGNGTQDSYAVPYRLASQVRAFSRSVQDRLVRSVDLIRVSDGRGERYGQLFGFGFDTAVLERRNRFSFRLRDGSVHPRPGFEWYALSILLSFLFQFSRSRREIEVELHNGVLFDADQKPSTPFDSIRRHAKPALTEAGTRPYYAKKFAICPCPVDDDGLLDFYLMRLRGRMTAALNLNALWSGKHQLAPHLLRGPIPQIEHFRARSLRLRGRAPFPYHIDGELFEAAPDADGGIALEIETISPGLNVLVPPAFIEKSEGEGRA